MQFNQSYRYSLRKYSVGLVSVAIGVGMNQVKVSAQAVENQTSIATEEVLLPQEVVGLEEDRYGEENPSVEGEIQEESIVSQGLEETSVEDDISITSQVEEENEAFAVRSIPVTSQVSSVSIQEITVNHDDISTSDEVFKTAYEGAWTGYGEVHYGTGSITISFVGNRFEIYGDTHSSYGPIRVSVDGRELARVTLQDPYAAGVLLYSYKGLENKYQTLKIETLDGKYYSHSKVKFYQEEVSSIPTEAGIHAVYGSIHQHTKQSEYGQLLNQPFQQEKTSRLWLGDEDHKKLLLVNKGQDLENVRIKSSDFKSGEHTLSSDFLKYYFIKETEGHIGRGGIWGQIPGSDVPREMIPDILDRKESINLEKGKIQAVWLKLKVPEEMKAGTYTGYLTISADNLEEIIQVPYQFEIVNLKRDQKNRFSMELWQYPFTTARYYGLTEDELFGEKHMEILKQELSEYVKIGGTAITTTISEDPWNSQTYDAYPSMVKWTKKVDGKYQFDFTHFDKYVNLAMSLGIDKQIKSFSLTPWENQVAYYDEASGTTQKVKLPTGSQEWKEVWGQFLESYIQHLDEKSWFDIAYLSMDERPLSDMQHVVDLVQNYKNKDGQTLKLSAAMNYSAEKADLLKHIHDISIDLAQILDPESVRQVALERRAMGYTTTLYTCVGDYPSSFARSAPVESAWTLWYAASLGMDGYLRWAYDAWVEDPLNNIDHWWWESGDPFLVYPGDKDGDKTPRTSPRFEEFKIAKNKIEKLRYISNLSPEAKEEVDQLLATVRREYGRVSYYGAKESTGVQQDIRIENEVRRLSRIADSLEAKYSHLVTPGENLNDVGLSDNYIPRQELLAQAGSVQEGKENAIENVLDNNPLTIWHSSWAGAPKEDLWMTLDAGKVRMIDGLAYQSRGDGGENGNVNRYEIYVSQDNVNWKKVSEGRFMNTGDWEEVEFLPEAARYVKIKAVETVGDGGRENTFMAASEIRLREDKTLPAPEQPKTLTQEEKLQVRKIFSIDAGRKYFSPDQLKHLVDLISQHGYTDLHLLLGNDGIRFLLDDMSLNVEGENYTSDAVKAALVAGTNRYYRDPNGNYLTQEEMDDLIQYANRKHINIIPVINSPGHMDGILHAMDSLGIKDPYFTYQGAKSERTVDLNNRKAILFTKELVRKYASYFKGKTDIFNIGLDEYANDATNAQGFNVLQGSRYSSDSRYPQDGYKKFVQYANDLSAIVKAQGLRPMAFNDGIYYNHVDDDGAFDKDIIVSMWTGGWGGYDVASAKFLSDKGHQIINTNDAWYYVIGRDQAGSGWYNLDQGLDGIAKTPINAVPKAEGHALPIMGSLIAVWADEPSLEYKPELVEKLLKEYADQNASYFYADYRQIMEIVQNIPNDLTAYTEASVKQLQEVLSTFTWNHTREEQAQVDQEAIALLAAYNGLVLKQIDRGEGIRYDLPKLEAQYFDIDFDRQVRGSSDLPLGETRLVQEGKKGRRVEYYEVKEGGSVLLAQGIVTEVVPEIIEIGSRVEDIQYDLSKIEVHYFDIDFDRQVRGNSDLPLGETRLVQEGKKGQGIEYYEVKAGNTVLLSKGVLIEAIPEILEVGTQVNHQSEDRKQKDKLDGTVSPLLPEFPIDSLKQTDKIDALIKPLLPEFSLHNLKPSNPEKSEDGSEENDKVTLGDVATNTGINKVEVKPVMAEEGAKSSVGKLLPETGEGNEYTLFTGAALTILLGLGLVGSSVKRKETP